MWCILQNGAGPGHTHDVGRVRRACLSVHVTGSHINFRGHPTIPLPYTPLSVHYCHYTRDKPTLPVDASWIAFESSG